MNLYDFRPNESDTEWVLPPWGYPLGIGVNPLFLAVDGKVRPIGTAFNLGGGINITVTAYHCVEEAIREDPVLYRRFLNGQTVKDGTLNRCSLYILRNYLAAERKIHCAFVPLEHVSGGPPNDVVFCASQFTEGYASLENKISFQLPHPDDAIHSVGYHDFKFPEGGISLDAIDSFDWENDYSHELRVVEGKIKTLFLQRYANGYLHGPCFSFSGTIRSAMSGGPIFDLNRGIVFGMNSASAFDANESLGSLFFPYVLNQVKFGVNLGNNPNFRFDSKQQIIQMLEYGSIVSDGSHGELVYQQTDQGTAVSMRVEKAYQARTFDDLAAMQSGIKPTAYEGPIFVRRQEKNED